jgi:CMP-N,N'-diacetyllegionaminic acid synthase
VRPSEFATDSATDLEVFTHALEFLAETGYSPEIVVQLRATSPVRTLAVVQAAVLRMLEDPSADSLKSVSPVDKSPYKMWRIAETELKPLLEVPGMPEAHSMPRQILPKVYTGNGYIDIIRPRAILEQRSMVGKRILPYVIEEECFDLDYPSQIAGIEQALKAQSLLVES